MFGVLYSPPEPSEVQSASPPALVSALLYGPFLAITLQGTPLAILFITSVRYTYYRPASAAASRTA